MGGPSSNVHPELGVLTWRGEVDVAPETLYAEATGSGLPDSVEEEDASANESLQHTG